MNLQKKSLKPLLHTSEIIIRPGPSPSYLRVLLVLYLFTLALIFYSNIHLILQILFLFVSSYLFWRNYKTKNPCPEITELRINATKWVVKQTDGKLVDYTKSSILFHNPLFQVIQLGNESANQLIVLFNDQVNTHDLRILHIRVC